MDKKEVKRWTASRKAELIIESFSGKKTSAKLCRQNGISQSTFFQWKKDFISGGTSSLKNGNGTEKNELSRKLAETERKLGEMVVEKEILQEAVERQFSKNKTQ